jgi:hypothetical protein
MAPAIFLSASVPGPSQPEYYEMGARPRTIESAVTALTTSVLARGGRLVFGGHPTISPMVALAALQSRGPGPGGEPPVAIYQAEPYRNILPDETWTLFRTGVARIEWTPAVDGETVAPGKPPPQKSLARMRERMLEGEQPVAMVCIGGMKGIVDEFEMFQTRREGFPTIILAGTGGASRHLAESIDRGLLAFKPATVIPDLGALADGRSGDPPEPIPYPYIVERIVDHILGPPKR